MVDTILSLKTSRGDAALVQTTRDLQRDLTRSDVPAHAVEKPSRPGEKGDPFTLGLLAISLVTSGTVVAFLECLKAYIARDKTLSFSLRRPDGSDIEVVSHNIDSTELRAEVESLLSTE